MNSILDNKLLNILGQIGDKILTFLTKSKQKASQFWEIHYYLLLKGIICV
jgi:hypothetical protein